MRADEIQGATEDELVAGINAIGEVESMPAWRSLVLRMSERAQAALATVMDSKDPHEVMKASGEFKAINDTLNFFSTEKEGRRRQLDQLNVGRNPAP